MQTLLLSAPLLPPPMRQRAPCTEQHWGLGARHTKCCCPAAHTNQRAICITGAMLMSRSASPPGARRARKDPPRAPWLFGKLFVFFFCLACADSSAEVSLLCYSSSSSQFKVFLPHLIASRAAPQLGCREAFLCRAPSLLPRSQL